MAIAVISETYIVYENGKVLNRKTNDSFLLPNTTTKIKPNDVLAENETFKLLGNGDIISKEDGQKQREESKRIRQSKIKKYVETRKAIMLESVFGMPAKRLECFLAQQENLFKKACLTKDEQNSSKQSTDYSLNPEKKETSQTLNVFGWKIMFRNKQKQR